MRGSLNHNRGLIDPVSLLRPTTLHSLVWCSPQTGQIHRLAKSTDWPNPQTSQIHRQANSTDWSKPSDNPQTGLIYTDWKSPQTYTDWYEMSVVPETPIVTYSWGEAPILQNIGGWLLWLPRWGQPQFAILISWGKCLPYPLIFGTFCNLNTNVCYSSACYSQGQRMIADRKMNCSTRL